MRKLLAFLILLLFISTTIVPASSIEESVNKNDVANFSGNTIYVDDDNTEGPWEGTLEHPYYYIQQGIEVANPGDTVHVFSGVYRHQYVTITTESINLVGEGKETTIISPNIYGWGIEIFADYVNVSGFTFKYTGATRLNKIMLLDASHCIISDNAFSEMGPFNCLINIRMLDAHYNVITRNEFTIVPATIFQYSGIDLINSHHNIISDNIIEKRVLGISLYMGSTNNIIMNNQLLSVERSIGLFESSNNNKITGNCLNGNIFGMSIVNSSENEITHNRFENNTKARDGIWIAGRTAVFFNSKNYWDNNYWGRGRILPKIIFGYKGVIKEPWYKHLPNAFEVDWHPARE